MQQAPVTKSHEHEDDNDEIDLMGLLGTLIDHKWLIAGVTGVFMAAGVAYALLATPVYQANALIQVEVFGWVALMCLLRVWPVLPSLSCRATNARRVRVTLPFHLPGG